MYPSQSKEYKTKSMSQKSSINLFLVGAFLSLLGEMLGFLILNFYIMEKFNSVQLLALFNFFRLIPILISCGISGYLSDIYSKKSLLVLAYIGAIFGTVALFLYFFFSLQSFWLLVFIVFFRSLFLEFEPPARYAIIPEIASGSDVFKITSTYTALINLSLIIAPLVFSLVLQQLDYTYLVFVFILIALILVTLSVLNLKTIYADVSKSPSSSSSSVQSGHFPITHNSLRGQYDQVKKYLFSKSNPTILIILSGYVFMFCIQPFNSLSPAFAKNFLDMSKTQYAQFVFACSSGALLAAFGFKYFIKNISPLFIYVSGLIAGFCMALTATLNNILFSTICVVLLGFWMQSTRTANRIYIQINAPKHLRGKLLSLSLFDRAFIPLGTICIGYLSIEFPIQISFRIFGMSVFFIYLALLTTSLFFHSQRKLYV